MSSNSASALSFPPYGMSAVNCTSYPPLQPNPDISGIGVLTSFLATAYITLFCCIAKVILDQKKYIGSVPRFRRWSLALEDVIVTFSDLQLVTGISIIIAGLSQLEWGLPVYHFLEVGNLAWFSTMTHILTLTVMRDTVRKNQALRILRIISMGILVVLLICVMAPIGYLVSPSSADGVYPITPEFPAWCLYRPSVRWESSLMGLSDDPVVGPVGKGPIIHSTSGYNLPYAFLTLGIIIYGYFSRVALLFPGLVSRSVLRILEGQPWLSIESTLAKLEKLSETSANQFVRKLASLGHRLIHSFSVLTIAGKQLYGTRTWEFTWLTLALFWGTIRIFVERKSFIEAGKRTHDVILSQMIAAENFWGFGQVLALGLLVVPFVGFAESLLSPEEPVLTPYNYSNNLRASSPNTSGSGSALKTGICAEPWYPNLLMLWFIMSLEIGGWSLLLIAFNNGTLVLGAKNGTEILGRSTGSTITQFALGIVWHVVILWVYILLCLPNCKFLSNKWISRLFAFFSFCLAFAGSLLLVFFYDYY